MIEGCGGPSDHMLEDLWTMVASARQQVDVATLFDPTGRFEIALVNAIAYALSQLDTNQILTVRILLGEQHAPPSLTTYLEFLRWVRELPSGANPLVQMSHAKALAATIGKVVKHTTSAGKLRLFVGVYKPSLLVWNHAKIVAVDGKTAVVGGHNLWEQAYLGRDPVHDLSIVVRGPAATSAHRFASALWDVVCSAPVGEDSKGAQSVWTLDGGGDVTSAVSFFDGGFDGGEDAWECAEAIRTKPPTAEAKSGALALAVGRLGTWSTGNAKGSGRNPADDALVAMIRNSTGPILVAQQDLTGPMKLSERLLQSVPNFAKLVVSPFLSSTVGAWLQPILRELAVAAAQDRPVRVIISPPGGEYGSLAGQAVVAAILKDWPGRPDEATKTEAQLMCNVEVAFLRRSFSRMDTGRPLHAKLLMVNPGNDDGAVYVGSHNLYSHDLAEFGYILFGKQATQAVSTSFWDPAWKYSASDFLQRVYRPAACVIGNDQGAADQIGQLDLDTGLVNGGGEDEVGPDSFRYPNGVAIGAGQRLLIADSGNGRVLLHELGLGAKKLFGQLDFKSRKQAEEIKVTNLGLTDDGIRLAFTGKTLVIADTKRNRVLLIQNNKKWVLGQDGESAGGAGTTAARLKAPTGVWSDGLRVIVADTGNNRVLIWSKWPTESGTKADRVLGQTSFTAGGAATGSGLNAPRGVHYDGKRLYVADSGNNRVLIWNGLPSSDGARPDLVLGQADLKANEAATKKTAMSSPRDVEVAGDTLFVADSGNNRVLAFSPLPVDSGGPAQFVLGQPDFTSSGAGVARNRLRAPQDLTVLDNRLIVADTGNHRIVWFDVNVQGI